MNCPYCKKEIYALTGLQELQKFQKHLRKCTKKTDAVILTDGTIIDPINKADLLTALEIRAKSEQ